jgi:hypothetical protein
MSKGQNKSPFKPASPDSLSKRLSKCKTRRERQNVMLAAQIESEDRNSLEQAAINAAAKAAHDATLLVRLPNSLATTGLMTAQSLPRLGPRRLKSQGRRKL